MIKSYKEFIIERSQYQFGCVLVRYNLPNWKDFINKVVKISPDDVYDIPGKNYGIESEPHLTLLYGLHPEVQNEEVQSCFENLKLDDFKIDIDGVDIFENQEYDVVKLKVVNTPTLQKVHEKLSTLPNSDKYPQYNPHITCAYVKKGAGEKYVMEYKTKFENIKNISYTKPTGPEYLIEL